LAKTILNLKELHGYVFAPGDIYWLQKSGAEVLLSPKFDFLNFQLMEKLAGANHKLLIEYQINLHVQSSFVDYFKRHKLELLISNKIKWRKSLIELFNGEFSENKASQFALSQFGWKVFSKIEIEEAKKHMEGDKDLFLRSMNISASYTLCAFLLGYYNDDFLSNLFTETFLNLISIKKSQGVIDLKIQLESIRLIDRFESSHVELLEDLFLLSNKKNVFLGERYDGSGYWKINSDEMNDLELLFVALNRHYSYITPATTTIFNDIKNANFDCDQRILIALRRYIESNDENMDSAQTA
jgi:hypothetical protein